MLPAAAARPLASGNAGRDSCDDRPATLVAMSTRLAFIAARTDAAAAAQAALQALGYTSAEAARALNQVRDQADTADKLILLAVRQLSGM